MIILKKEMINRLWIIVWVLGLCLVTAKVNDNFNWFSMFIVVIASIRLFFDIIYIPLFTRLIVDDDGIRFAAGIFSWSREWESVDCVYIQDQSIFLTKENKIDKIVIDATKWISEGEKSINLADVLKQHVSVKPHKEMPNRPMEFQDYHPAFKRALIVLGVLLVIVLLASVFIHRYYVNEGGTHLLFYILCGGLASLIATIYFYKKSVPFEGTIATIVLSCVLGLFIAPIIVKGYTVLANDVETHRFQLIKKNGGYQHWQSLSDESLNVKLGSVNNKIHTENDQGTIIKMNLIKGRFLTLYLPDQIVKTRYRVE